MNEHEIDRPGTLDWIAGGVALLATVILIWMAVSGCGGVPLEVCMEHPRYGQVCVTVVGGRVVKVDAKVAVTDEAELAAWAQERVK